MPDRAIHPETWLALLALLALLACGEEPAPPLETAEAAEADLRLGDTRPRGLWVLCEGSQRVLEHPERVDELIEYASAIAGHGSSSQSHWAWNWSAPGVMHSW